MMLENMSAVVQRSPEIKDTSDLVTVILDKQNGYRLEIKHRHKEKKRRGLRSCSMMERRRAEATDAFDIDFNCWLGYNDSSVKTFKRNSHRSLMLLIFIATVKLKSFHCQNFPTEQKGFFTKFSFAFYSADLKRQETGKPNQSPLPIKPPSILIDDCLGKN
ncbi:hypothetical protein JTB14_018156 [Gonioctena quinquepunctata]|nr:hypothetical protein JTB14_018156 [Gonioctena quinquepunctata]